MVLTERHSSVSGIERIQNALEGLPTVELIGAPCAMALTQFSCELLGSPGELLVEICGGCYEAQSTHSLVNHLVKDIIQNGIRSDPFMVNALSGIYYQYVKLPLLWECDPTMLQGCHDALPWQVCNAQRNGSAVYQVVFSDTSGHFPLHSKRVLRLWRLHITDSDEVDLGFDLGLCGRRMKQRAAKAGGGLFPACTRRDKKRAAKAGPACTQE